MREDGWNTLRLSYKDARLLVYGSSDTVSQITPDDVIYIWYTRILEVKIYDERYERSPDKSYVRDKFYIEDEEGSHVVLIFFGESHFVAAMKDKKFYEQGIPDARW